MRSTRAMRRALGLLLASALAGSVTAQPRQVQAPAKAPPRPNVLLIMIDDLKPTLGAFGDTTAISPNIDALAARGTRFEHAYANQAVCAPSRNNLMSGRRSTSTGMYEFGMDVRRYVPGVVTMPELFKRNGYTSGSIGKVFHIGHGSHEDPQSWSVPAVHDHVIEYLERSSTGGKPTSEQALFNEVPVAGNVWRYAATLGRGAAWEDPDVPDDAYADGRTAKRAIARLHTLKAAGKPFFLAVGFARPHLPFSVPKKYWNLYDPAKLPMPRYEDMPVDAPAFANKLGGEIAAYTPVPKGQVPGKQFPEELKRKLIHGYYAGVSYTDAQIGKVLAALKADGLEKNTIVVLWGDHGWHLGDHGIWTKHTNYEQATRQPLIFAGPGIAAGKSAAQIAETVDVFPTLEAFAGLPRAAGMQPLDGIDLRPALADAASVSRPYAYHSYPRGKRIGQAIRTARYRLIRWTQEGTGERVYELYDLQNDPDETRNIANAQPAVKAELDRYLDAQPKPVTLRLAAERPTAPDAPASRRELPGD